MTLNLFTHLFAAAALLFSIAVFARRLKNFNALPAPVDRAAPKGDVRAGVLYAFTLGMMPWAKESTRRHFVPYVRGIAFHLAIFLGLAIFVGSPWLGLLPFPWRTGLAVLSGLGAIFGLAGFVARLVEHNLKALSTVDDYFAVLLVSLFLITTTAALVDLAYLPVFYLVSAVMLAYAPLGKIRHCIYYAYSRLFFGKMVGRRAILPHSQQHPVEVIR